jgi:hypothetical protein
MNGSRTQRAACVKEYFQALGDAGDTIVAYMAAAGSSVGAASIP